MKSKLSKYMEFYNITQKELSDATGINRNTIGRYSNDSFESINKEHLDLLCSFFKCSLDELFEVDTTLTVKYPSVVVEQSINNIPFPNNPIITDVDENSPLKSEINKPYRLSGKQALKHAKQFEETNGYNPIPTDEEYYDMEQMQERFNMEYDLANNLFLLIDNILDNADISEFSNIFKSDIETYKKWTNSIEASRFMLVYRILYIVIVQQLKNQRLLDFIKNMRKVYSNGLFFDISDDEIKELLNESTFLLKDLKSKQKD